MFCGQSSSSSFGDDFSGAKIDELDDTIVIKKDIFKFVSI
jgi:hypothetical protein